MSAECVLILYQGAEPEICEIQQLVGVVEREAGVDLVGVRISTYQAAEPAEMLAHALVLRLEDEGDVRPDSLRRTTTYTVEVTDGRRVVAVVWADEINAWVRRTHPAALSEARAHRARCDSTAGVGEAGQRTCAVIRRQRSGRDRAAVR